MELSKVGRLLPAAARRPVRRLVVRSRFLGLRATDAVLVSYPKSGSTWLRFLLAQVLTGREADYDFIRDTMPRVGRHRRAPHVLPTGGRLLRTHEPLQPYYGRSGQPVLHLVRNGRDVCLSYFNHVRRQGYTGDVPTFVEQFIDGDVDGYGTWPDHVLAGLAYAKVPAGPFLDIRYEELRADPVPQLSRILSFLGADVDEPALERVVDANTRDRMRVKEKSSSFLQGRIGNGGTTAENGTWVELVPADLRRRFDTMCGRALVAAGYERDPVAVGSPDPGG
jgi:hypothetical protein